jgi:hypothetical protein
MLCTFQQSAKAIVTACALIVLPIAAPAQPAYPRLANLYLHGSVHTQNIDALARWDLLVLNTVWPEAELAKLRAIHPDIRILLHVNAYSVRWPEEGAGVWAQTNIAYADDNDLWWYDRDAAPASDWPGSRMVNITDLGARGPQGSWREFMTRRIAELVQSRPSADGIMLDNFWHRLSWNQERLQLDSDCNPAHNAVACDGSVDPDSTLDDLWNRALTQLAQDLRQRFDVIEGQRSRPLMLVGNGATDYHEWINGSLHEFFPSGWAQIDYGNPYGYNWNVEMFDLNGGYLTAPFSASPQRTNIMNASFGDASSEPYRSDEFERHKRFTFVSTLLGDGYYSLDAAGAGGHGVVWWEAEYDHAGRGTGYLGRALGPMSRLTFSTGPEILRNGAFVDGLEEWFSLATAADAAIAIDTGVFRSAPAAATMRVQSVAAGGELKAWHNDLVLERDASYTLTVWTRADRDMDLVLELYSTDCPNNRCLRAKTLRVTNQWLQSIFSFVAPASTAASLNLFVREAGNVWIDDVSLRRGSSDVFRRDFENGIVLLNYTDEARTITLDDTFTRLDIPGSAVFDGATVTHESVSAWDGRVLLRTTPLPLPPVQQGWLHPNEPNPFNPATRIRFSLSDAQHVQLAVYDPRGKLVRILHSGELPAGENHSVVWNGTDRRGRPARTGVYVYSLVGAGFTQARKMMLIR